jgi:hypothetical protein
MVKQGTCVFVSYSPSTKSMLGDDSYIQSGYISCSGGGSAWQPKTLTIFNQGPGDFYIGPIEGKSDPQEMPSGQYNIYTMINGTEPNVYYAVGSQNTTPNFTITVSN